MWVYFAPTAPAGGAPQSTTSGSTVEVVEVVVVVVVASLSLSETVPSVALSLSPVVVVDPLVVDALALVV
jgi:hypothetical protein